jgi:hypothetical protein
MAANTETVTVYRSADSNAEQDATAVYNLLVKSGLNPELVDSDTPGVLVGSWEVRVPPDQSAAAESLVRTLNQDDPAQADPSHDLDMVTLRETQGATGELEAMSIRSILEANGIPCLLVGASTLPNLAFTIEVSNADLARAETVLAEAQAAGPAAAAEAERESEETDPGI